MPWCLSEITHWTPVNPRRFTSQNTFVQVSPDSTSAMAQVSISRRLSPLIAATTRAACLTTRSFLAHVEIGGVHYEVGIGNPVQTPVAKLV